MAKLRTYEWHVFTLSPRLAVCTLAADICIGELPTLLGSTKAAAATKMSMFALERSGVPSVLQHGPPAG